MQFLGISAELWKVTVGLSCLSVRLYIHLSIHVEQHGSHGLDFHEILCLNFLI